jgi:ankyrin repeat protein
VPLDDEVCPSRRAVANLKSTIKMATGVELVAAAGRGERREVASLLRRGASVEAFNRNGCTALMAAAQNGHTDTVNALAGTHNANVEAVDRNGWTALMCAATTATRTP